MSYSFGLSRSDSAGARFGHHASTLLIVSIIGVVAVGLHPLPGLLFLTVPLALFLVVIMSWVLMRRHDRTLCEQCAHAMPLNPGEQATRLRRRFWMAHTGSEPRFLVPYVVVLISSNFATTTTLGRIGWAVIQLSMIYLILAQSTHRRLQPWCPWCSEGGGGQEAEDMPPVLPHDDRQLI
jgi:hypothetical protein